MCVHIERGVSIARACSTDYNEPIQRRWGALPKKARERLARDRTRSPEVNIPTAYACRQLCITTPSLLGHFPMYTIGDGNTFCNKRPIIVKTRKIVTQCLHM